MADIKVTTWQMKAKFGDAVAMNNLGLAYREGTGVEKDLSESASWFYKAATKGNMEAMYNLAVAFYQGIGVKVDPKEGFKWMQLAAELGHSKALDDVYKKYYKGIIVEKDEKKAFYWLEKSAEAGNTSSMRFVAMAYSEKNFMKHVEIDLVKSTAWYKKAAESGDERAMHNLARNYLNGIGTEKDYSKAFEWYSKSAEAGVKEAMFGLGYMYLKGCFVEQDLKKAIKWFKKSADCGLSKAWYFMGKIYIELDSKIQDIDEGIKCYKKAADLGDGEAMKELGLLYYNGSGAEKDLVKAADWFEMAAAKEVVEAMVYFGAMLQNGEGVTKSPKKAVEWYKKAANAGNLRAMYQLGYVYLEGIGVEKNLDKSEKWLNNALKNGYEGASVLLAKNKLARGRSVKAAQEAVKLLEKVENKSAYEDYEELLSKAQKIIAYEEKFRQLMYEKFKIEIPGKTSGNMSAMEELDSMIGLQTVKEEVHSLKSFVEVQKKLEEMGNPTQKMSFHMVFTGNPGTGKTTVARIIARVLHEIGIISTDKFVECDRTSLVGQHIGETAQKTQKVIDSALGGVLFIDEAYTLSPRGSSRDFGPEAINTLLKAMEDHRDNLVIIVAGYTNEMREFINTNPGLQSRFSTYLDFEDYTVPEMLQIFKLTCDSRGYIVDDCAWEGLIKEITKINDNKSENFANGRDVRNLFEKVLKKQTVRLSHLEINRLSEMDLVTILEEDIVDKTVEEEVVEGNELPIQKSAMEELGKMIGLASVKTEVHNLKKKILAQKKLREMGRNVENASMHMVFTGNPGTGKTTVARIIAQVFHEIGVIPTDKLVECDRAKLVGRYIGETAPKTQEVIDSALGGVLFIDEAYTLSPLDSPRDFGPEAINTLLKAMEDNRDNLIVIVAGYKKEMQDFLASNPGLESRFKYFIDFPDYTAEEMYDIFKSYCAKEQYGISQEAEPYLIEHFVRMNAEKGEKFGNGRDVRNYYEKVVQRVLIRFTEIGEEATEEDLVIRVEDVIENHAD